MNTSPRIAALDEMEVDTETLGIVQNGHINDSCANWTHPAELRPRKHYESFEEFRDTANEALQGAFPVHRQPRNATVSVLMLSWEDDDLGVMSELIRLRQVFDQEYHFDTEIWEIPSQKPTRRLCDKIIEWKESCCENQVQQGEPLPLLILYYGGHAEEKVNNHCVWRRCKNN
jgi:hypothetical protein